MIDTDPLTVQVTAILSHNDNSTGPGFLIDLEEVVPEALIVYYLEHSGGQTVLNESTVRNGSNVLSFHVDILPLGRMINLTYLAHLNPSNEMEGNISQPVNMNYTTIKQEGIGLMVLAIIKLLYQTVWICIGQV